VDFKEQGGKAMDVVEGWFEMQENTVDTALKVADFATNLRGASSGDGSNNKGTLDSDDAQKMFVFAKQGLSMFRGARQFVRGKLDDGLDFLVSDNDENLPVGLTVGLSTASILVCFAAARSAEAAQWLDFSFLPLAAQAAKPTALLASTLLHRNWKALSGGLFLMALLGRAVEVQAGSAALLVGYVAGGVVAKLLCAFAGVAAPIGLPAVAGMLSLLVMTLGMTSSNLLPRPRGILDALRSMKALRRASANFDSSRAMEAVLITVFSLAWATASLPTHFSGGLWRLRAAGPRAYWLATQLRALPPWMLALLSGSLAALACSVLLLPAWGVLVRVLRTIVNRVKKMSPQRPKAADTKNNQ